MIRAIRLELAKPLDEPWETIDPLLRTLATATPKLLNAAYDSLIASGIVGAAAVKAAICPDVRAESPAGISYQAVTKGADDLRAWASKEKADRLMALEVPGRMASAIARAACQAYARRDQGRVRFHSKRVLVLATQTRLAKSGEGYELTLRLRSSKPSRVRFAVASSKGAHRYALRKIVSGEWQHGDCKLQRDEDRSKWYALLSYEQPDPEPVSIDPARTIAVHRGIRNALYVVSTTGHVASVNGGKFSAQRRALYARMNEVRRISACELGAGAKGHGRSRRVDRYSVLEDKIARCAHTFCQQCAARVAELAEAWGCGHVVIEDYGGIEANPDPALRRVLDRFPMHKMKLAIESRLACVRREGLRTVSLALSEVDAAYVSTTCPRCRSTEPAFHNHRTGMFRCRACLFERPADLVAAYWMLVRSGADVSVWEDRFVREMRFANKGAAQ